MRKNSMRVDQTDACSSLSRRAGWLPVFLMASMGMAAVTGEKQEPPNAASPPSAPAENATAKPPWGRIVMVGASASAGFTESEPLVGPTTPQYRRGQTNSPPIPLHMFSLSPVKVRPLAAAFEKPVPARAVGDSEALQSRRGAAATEGCSESPLDLQKLDTSGCHDSTESPVLRSTAEGGRPTGASSQPTTILQ